MNKPINSFIKLGTNKIINNHYKKLYKHNTNLITLK